MRFIFWPFLFYYNTHTRQYIGNDYHYILWKLLSRLVIKEAKNFLLFNKGNILQARRAARGQKNNNKKLISTGAFERIKRIKKGNLIGANAHANYRGNDKDESYFIIKQKYS